MQKFTDIKSYLDSVCNQIRWKKARETVSQELENHINDQKDAYIADGMDDKSALEKAIQDMGDPVVTGEQLDRVHRPRPDWIMVGLVALLVAVGTIVQYYLSLGDSNMFKHYLFYAPIGIVAFIIAYFADYSIIGKYPKALFATALVIGVVATIIFPKLNGAVRGGFYFPILLVSLFAGIVYSQRGTRYKSFFICGVFYILGTAVSLAMPTIGGAILFSIACLVIMTAAVCKDWFSAKRTTSFAIIYTPAILLPLLAIISSEKVRSRLMYAFVPQLDPFGYGYQAGVIRSVLSDVKLWGAAGLPDIEYMLDWKTDYMLTYLMAKFGAVVGIFLILLILVLIVRLFIVVSRQKSMLGFAVSLSVALAVTIQSVFYVLGNLGLIIFSSTLPLLSFGGVGFVVNMALIGLVLSTFRRNSITKDSIKHSTPQWNRVLSLFHGRIVVDLRDRREI